MKGDPGMQGVSGRSRDATAQPSPEPGALRARSEEAAALLKAIAHDGRLTILCHLAGGERSVSELETLVGFRQAVVSQQLAALRLEGLVESRRDGKSVRYSLRDPRAARLLTVIRDLFFGVR